MAKDFQKERITHIWGKFDDVKASAMATLDAEREAARRKTEALKALRLAKQKAAPATETDETR